MRRVLIIRFSSFGDIIQALAASKFLQDCFKDKIVIDNQKSTDAFTNKESKNTLMNFLVGNETRGVKEPEKAFSAQASDDYSMSKAMLRRRNLHSLAESKK